jgi:exopolyphosphatase/guanosine-5'-triphosphate,3'-diphosphate pyrophosphatase
MMAANFMDKAHRAWASSRSRLHWLRPLRESAVTDAVSPQAAPPPRRRAGRWAHTYAALDLGTNNCRLLVARPAAHGFRVIDAFSRITRLGEGVGAAGRLSDAAMRRTIDALKVCAGKIRRRGADRARCVATEACRLAANGADFLGRVRHETGLELEIISSQEEARLAVAGCLPLLDPGCARGLIFDIGGGSTEVVWLDLADPSAPAVLAWTSLPVGVVKQAERAGGHRVTHDSYEAMIGEVRTLLAPFEAEQSIARDIAVAAADIQVLGTSGTVTTITAVHMDLPRYDRNQVDGSWMAFADVVSVSHRLRAMPYEDRVAHPCIGRERADLVVAGCAILEGIHRTWPAGCLRVADRGVREGLLAGMMAAADAEAANG